MSVSCGFFVESDSVGIRTRDPQLRRLLLYPAELRNHHFQRAKVHIFFNTAKFQTSKLIYVLSSNDVWPRIKALLAWNV